MSREDQWLLPEGIEEVLPPEAWRLESARRELLDLFARWGYALIMPPLIEYLESLLTGAGNDLDLQTFKVTDLMSGRMMGVRADMTPQAARIDAHPLRRDAPTRLVLHGHGIAYAQRRLRQFAQPAAGGRRAVRPCRHRERCRDPAAGAGVAGIAGNPGRACRSRACRHFPWPGAGRGAERRSRKTTCSKRCSARRLPKSTRCWTRPCAMPASANGWRCWPG